MTDFEKQSRRQFVKAFAFFAVSSSLGTRAWTAKAVAEVQPAPFPKPGLLVVDLRQFSALQNDFGSVRIGLTAMKANFQPVGFFYPVLINRDAGGVFHTLNSSCTHEGCTVPKLNVASKTMTCPCHQSRYAIDGERISGPANASLVKYNHRHNGDFLEIEIPDLEYSVTPVLVPAAPGGRLQLSFFAFRDFEYEVRSRTDVAAPWATVPFATTPEGEMTQTVFKGGGDVSVYVEAAAPNGFFAVTIRTREV